MERQGRPERPLQDAPPGHRPQQPHRLGRPDLRDHRGRAPRATPRSAPDSTETATSVDDTSEHSFRLYALEAKEGRILWEREVFRGSPTVRRHLKSSLANATPVTDGRRVVVLFGVVGVLASFDYEGRAALAPGRGHPRLQRPAVGHRGVGTRQLARALGRPRGRPGRPPPRLLPRRVSSCGWPTRVASGARRGVHLGHPQRGARARTATSSSPTAAPSAPTIRATGSCSGPSAPTPRWWSPPRWSTRARST